MLPTILWRLCLAPALLMVGVGIDARIAAVGLQFVNENDNRRSARPETQVFADNASDVELWVAEFGYNLIWRVERHPRFLADVNGDGVANVIGLGDAGVSVVLSVPDRTHLFLPGISR